MKTRILILSLFVLSFQLQGQVIDAIFEHEILEYEIVELSGHDVLFVDNYQDSTIFTLSTTGINDEKFLSALTSDGIFLWQKKIDLDSIPRRLNVNEEYIFIDDNAHNLFRYNRAGEFIDSTYYYDEVFALSPRTYDDYEEEYYELVDSSMWYATGNSNTANFIYRYEEDDPYSSEDINTFNVVVNYNFNTKEYTKTYTLTSPPQSTSSSLASYEIQKQEYVFGNYYRSSIDKQTIIRIDGDGNVIDFINWNEPVVCAETPHYRIGHFGDILVETVFDFVVVLDYKCLSTLSSTYDGNVPELQGALRDIDCERSIIGKTGLYCGQDTFQKASYPTAPFFLEGLAAFYEIDSTTLRVIDYKNDSCIDQDGDGYSSAYDCFDEDPELGPHAEEIVGNDIDENCDGVAEVDNDGDGYTTLTDCDDTDPTIHPDATEIFNNDIDENCDKILELDQDLDGFGELTDCDDQDPNISPLADEIFGNSVDENCDGFAELDLDEDGVGDATDCDDLNPEVNPLTVEIPYDGFDNDCNPATLDDDLDQDGFVLADDCNDDDPNINPDAAELAENGIDEDCDGEDWILSSTYDLDRVKFTVYPSPATDVLFIKTQHEIQNIELLSLEGKLILSQYTDAPLNISAVQAGLYLCKVRMQNGKSGVRKVVVK